jgi:hypothetical protein
MHFRDLVTDTETRSASIHDPLDAATADTACTAELGESDH